MVDSQGYAPRRFLVDVSSTPTPEEEPVLHMVKCPFCRVHVGGEQNFREHLHKECEEAPREVHISMSDWRQEFADELDEFASEEEETERSVSERYADEDTPGEVLPV